MKRLNRIRPCIIAVALALLSADTRAQSAEVKLTERVLLDGAVTMLIPDSFTLMSEEMLRLKYPNERRPTTVFTNERGSVNLAANLTSNPIRPDQLPQLREVMAQQFKSLYPSATWHRNEAITQDGREYFVLDLVTPAVDTQVRNIMLATSFRGRLLMFSFNVTRELESSWLAIGQKMLASVKIKE